MEAALHTVGLLAEGQSLSDLPEDEQRQLEAEFGHRRHEYELRQMMLTSGGERQRAMAAVC